MPPCAILTLAKNSRMNRQIPVGRSLRTAMTGLSSIAARGLVGISSLITIPLMLRHLGAERFGLWMSIVSLQAILSIADFGLGNSLLNAVAVAFGKGDEVLIWRSIRTALRMQCLLSSAMAAAFLAAYPFVDWPKLFNIHTVSASAEVGPTLLILVLAFCLRLIINVIQQAQMGLQRGYVANIWTGLGNGVALAGMILALEHGAGLPTLCLVFVGCPVAAGGANVVSWLWRMAPGRPANGAERGLDGGLPKQMLLVGLQFFFLQATAALIGGMDPLIAGHILGPKSVADLAVAQKPFELVSIFLVLLSQPLWPAYREAVVSRDVRWVRRTLLRALTAALLVSGIAAITMGFAGRYLISVWAGPGAHPSTMLIVGYGIANVVTTLLTQASIFLNAMGKINFQLAVLAPAAVVALILKFSLTEHFGLAAIPWITVAVWGVMTGPPLILYMRRLIPRLSTIKV
jgi:O-antigen/teichoic acid export membrane protein